MLKNIQVEKIFLAVGYTDLRLGIDGLLELIQNNFGLNPFSSALFLFCGRRSDRIKAILWDDDGFLLLNKRLEQGRFRWPRNDSELKEITPQQYRWLLEGLDIVQPKALRPVHGLSII